MGGILATATLSAAIRRKARKKLALDPALKPRIDAARALRAQLESKGSLTQAEKHLLKNVRVLLRKVEGFHLGRQLITSSKTVGGLVASIPLLVLIGLAGEGSFLSNPWAGVHIGSSDGRTLGIDASKGDAVDVPDGSFIMNALSQNA